MNRTKTGQAMSSLDYAMFDADNHLYEADDAFTRHLDPKFSGEFVWMTDDSGRRHIILHGRHWPYIPNPTFDPIAMPGCYELMFDRQKSLAQLRAEGVQFLEPLEGRPEYRDRDARLRRMDEQGVEACWMFPTMVSGIEHQTRDDVDLTYGLLNALNEWIHDEWGFGYKGRIYAMPVVCLADPERAVEQLQLGIDRGARSVMLRPAPAATRLGPVSPGHPMFDPFWALAAEAEIAVTCHTGETGYHEYAGDWTGRRELRPFGSAPPYNKMFVEGRAVTDFITALTVHGAFERHPRLRIVTIENGCFWVPDLVDKFKKYYAHYRESFPGDPVASFERNVWVSPFWEDDITRLRDFLPVEHILAGSDWPHPEGLANPLDFVKSLQDFNTDDQRKIMRDNGFALLGR